MNRDIRLEPVVPGKTAGGYEAADGCVQNSKCAVPTEVGSLLLWEGLLRWAGPAPVVEQRRQLRENSNQCHF